MVAILEMKYRKKPIIIEAEQYQPFEKIEGVTEVIEETWMPGYITPKRTVIRAFIHTLEGDMQISVGDFIVTGIRGEKYPCKPDIFEQTYDPVNEDKL